MIPLWFFSEDSIKLRIKVLIYLYDILRDESESKLAFHWGDHNKK